MSGLKKLLSLVSAAAVTVSALAVNVSALEAYDPYSYDRWGDAVSSQAGYTAEEFIDGEMIGCGNFYEPADLYISHDDLMYIADRGNNRIVITDLDFNFKKEMRRFPYSDDVQSKVTVNAAALTTAELPSGSYTLKYGPEAHIVHDDANDKDEKFAGYEITDQTGNVVATIAEDGVTLSGGFTWFEGDVLTLNFDGSSVSGATVLTSLKRPTGVFVDQYTENLYICDTENSRVLKCSADGVVVQIFGKPQTELYDQNLTYNPSKVLVDKAGNVYVVVRSITSGAVMFNSEGEFLGFYGANRVEATAEVIANAFWNLISTDAQREHSQKQTPIGFTNFDIDEDGFIYTVTDSQELRTDLVKKLNPRGNNIIDATGASDMTFGDISPAYYSMYAKNSSLNDIDIGPNGELNILDFQHGRVFQYDKECWLLFIVGGSGNQLGLFNSATAIESHDNKIYVLDSLKNNITIFTRTVFGEIVTNAANLYNDGLYEESLEPWRNVLKYDGNYRRAYIGIGNALYNRYEYREAMDYFEISISRGRYNKAYEGYRDLWLKANYRKCLVVIVILIILIIVYKQFRKRGKIVYPWEKNRKGGV